MAAVPHVKTAFARGLTGINVIDATYQTLVVGAGNGASFAYLQTDLIFLRNDTGGDATYTIKVSPSTAQTAAGATLTSPTKVVVTAKNHTIRLSDVFSNPANGLVTIECDVAAKLLVLDVTG